MVENSTLLLDWHLDAPEPEDRGTVPEWECMCVFEIHFYFPPLNSAGDHQRHITHICCFDDDLFIFCVCE